MLAQTVSFARGNRAKQICGGRKFESLKDMARKRQSVSAATFATASSQISS
jgi:hypothetical protein